MGCCPPECRISPSERSLYGALKTTTTQAWELRSRSRNGPTCHHSKWPSEAMCAFCSYSSGLCKGDTFLAEDRARVPLSYGCFLDVLDSLCPGPTVRRGAPLNHVGSSDKLTSAGRGKAAFLHQGCVRSL